MGPVLLDAQRSKAQLSQGVAGNTWLELVLSPATDNFFWPLPICHGALA